jgi:hypothetical protein
MKITIHYTDRYYGRGVFSQESLRLSSLSKTTDVQVPTPLFWTNHNLSDMLDLYGIK